MILSPGVTLSRSKICKENKLREFKLNLLHRIVLTKKELNTYGTENDSDCLHCGELDSIEHTILGCQFTSFFTRQAVEWFNAINNTRFYPAFKENLFGMLKQSLVAHVVMRRFNYILRVSLYLFKQAKRKFDYFVRIWQ